MSGTLSGTLFAKCCSNASFFYLWYLLALIILWLGICAQQRIFAGSNVNDLHLGYSLKPVAAAPRRTLNRVQLNISPNTSVSSCAAIIPTCPHLQFKTMWLFCIDQSSVMFPLCSDRLNFARRKYFGSYLPSDTVLSTPSVNSLGAFFILRPIDQKENHRR